ncbi:MAG: methylmalonyl Co-A mutase-associated GTPase MeaB [Proteobacteria bacterium]|nr:methylmalonyl Co-A mutase-associated GTPase MeaB [Pseudomonadota bacterium]
MSSNTEALVATLKAGDRRALARAITLVESTRPDHRDAATALLANLTAEGDNTIRVGISGVPGVGKSTFIERLGNHVIDEGHRVAVLAVDPSSTVSGGSILGDKTRMPELTAREEAFIRPSPSGKTLGGVTRRTREAILLCEAAGFDVVIVETVGVGQSETAVADMTDMFVLLLLPGGGDELQGIKRGIIELADLVVVNKADGEMVQAAGRAAADYQNALQFMRPRQDDWEVPVQTCSALTGANIAEVWSTIRGFHREMSTRGAVAERRAEQARSWMWSEAAESLLDEVRGHPEVADQVELLERDVMQGKMPATVAADRLLRIYRGDR